MWVGRIEGELVPLVMRWFAAPVMVGEGWVC